MARLPASGRISMKDIWENIYGEAHSGEKISLNAMVALAGKQPKVEPWTLSWFHGYDHADYATLSVLPTTWRYGQGQGDKTFTVTATLGNAWQAQLSYTIGAGWMSFVGANNGIGTGGNQFFTVRAALNEDGPPDRTGIITVVSDAGDETVSIVQDWH